MKKLLLAATIAAAPSIALADWNADHPVPGLSSEFHQCMADENKDMPQLAACADAEVKRQKGALNAAFKKAYASMPTDGPARKDLVDEQKLWVKFNNEACDFYMDMGFDASLDYPICIAKNVVARTKALEDIAK